MVRLLLLYVFSGPFALLAMAEDNSNPNYIPKAVSTDRERGNLTWMKDFNPKFEENCNQDKLKEKQIEATDCIRYVWENLPQQEKDALRDEFDKRQENPVADDSPLGFEKTEEGKRLTQYLTERLGNIIFKSDANELKVFDHSKFYRLYNTQLSKNAVMALNSFCLDAKPIGNNSFRISQDEAKRNAQRLENLKKLKDWTPEDGDGEFKLCWISIASICDPSLNNVDDQIQKGKVDSTKAIDADGDEKYTQERACEVRITLEKVKNALTDLAVIQDKVNKGLSDKGPNLLNSNKVRLSANDLKNNEITSISSKEILESAKIKDVQEEKEGLVERCNSADSLDNDDCKKILFQKNDLANFEKQAQEIELQSLLERQKIENAIASAQNGEDDELKKYLKSKGYNEEEIAKMMSKENEGKLADQLYYQLKLNKETIVNRTREKIKNQMAEGVTKPAEVQAIKDYKSQEEQLQQLIHFNNVVSSLISVDQDGKEQRNGITLDLEIQGSAFDSEDGESDDKYGKKDIEKLREISGRGDAFNRDENSYLCIQVSTLNQIILGKKNESEKQNVDMLNDSKCD